MNSHIYFLLYEARDRIKIGWTECLPERFYQHRSRISPTLRVLGIRDGGKEEEERIHALFRLHNIPSTNKRGQPQDPASGKEWFRDVPEIREFIRDHTRSWDRSDTDAYHRTVPTLFVQGTPEWMAWLEEFARRLDLPAGRLVDRALSLLAEQQGFGAPPDRMADVSPPGPEVPEPEDSIE